MKRVEISRRAERDFSEIIEYIGRDRPAAADRFGARIDSIIDGLSENSKIGRLRDDLGRSLRSIPEGRYLVFYREHSDRVVIVRILHGARNLRRIWRQRD